MRHGRLCGVAVTGLREFTPAITIRGRGLLRCVMRRSRPGLLHASPAEFPTHNNREKEDDCRIDVKTLKWGLSLAPRSHTRVMRSGCRAWRAGLVVSSSPSVHPHPVFTLTQCSRSPSVHPHPVPPGAKRCSAGWNYPDGPVRDRQLSTILSRQGKQADTAFLTFSSFLHINELFKAWHVLCAILRALSCQVSALRK